MICCADLQRRQQLAIVVVEDDVVDADATAGFDGLGAPAHGELAAALLVVAGIAVGDRDEADLGARGDPFGGDPPGADVAIVGMGPEGDDAQGFVSPERGRQQGRREHEQARPQPT